jgi:hypothetical protein
MMKSKLWYAGYSIVIKCEPHDPEAPVEHEWTVTGPHVEWSGTMKAASTIAVYRYIKLQLDNSVLFKEPSG